MYNKIIPEPTINIIYMYLIINIVRFIFKTNTRSFGGLCSLTFITNVYSASIMHDTRLVIFQKYNGFCKTSATSR